MMNDSCRMCTATAGTRVHVASSRANLAHSNSVPPTLLPRACLALDCHFIRLFTKKKYTDHRPHGRNQSSCLFQASKPAIFAWSFPIHHDFTIISRDWAAGEGHCYYVLLAWQWS